MVSQFAQRKHQVDVNSTLKGRVEKITFPL